MEKRTVLLTQYRSLGSAARFRKGKQARDLPRVDLRKTSVVTYSFNEQISIWRILGPGLYMMLEDTGEHHRHAPCPFGALLSLVFIVFGGKNAIKLKQ